MTNKKILIAAQHFGATNAIAPIVKELIKQNYDVAILAHNQAEKGFPNKGLNDYKTSENYGIKNELPEFTKGSMSQILEKENPDFVLTGSSTERQYNGLEKSLIMASNEKEIQNAMLIDMWGEADLRFKDYNSNSLIVPNKVFVIDEYHKGLIHKQGIPEEKIYVTGNPDFDDTLNQAKNFSEERKNETINKFNRLDTKYLLGYIGNAFKIHSEQEGRGYWDLDNIKTLNEILNYNSNLSIFATIHGRMPDNEKDEIKDYLKNVNTRFKFLEQGNGFSQTDLIYLSDIVATPFSTDGIKAAIIGKPVLSMQGQDKLDKFATNNYGITYRVNNYNNLGFIVESILKNKENFYDLCPNLKGFKPDGKSVERILQLISRA